MEAEMTDNERDKIINEIASDVRLIKDRLERDFRTLYGNGKPGLVDDVTQAKTDILLLQQDTKRGESTWKTILHYVATLVSAIVSGGVVGWISARLVR